MLPMMNIPMIRVIVAPRRGGIQMKHLIHGIGFSSTSAASKNERDTGKMIAIVLLPGEQMADDRQDDVQVSIVMNVGDDKDQ
jgi:hypothetical protein